MFEGWSNLWPEVWQVATSFFRVVARQAEERRERNRIAREVFGYDADGFSFMAGTIHPYWPKQSHPANLVARDALAGPTGLIDVLRRGKPRVEKLRGSLIKADLRNNLVCLGGPPSNEVTQLVFEYEGPSAFRLRRPAGPAIDQWVWTFALDESEIPSVIGGWRGDKVQHAYSVPNWYIRDKDGSSVRAEESDKPGIYSSDLLLVTRVKNFLDREAFFAGRFVTVASGTHGLGTVGVALLLQNADILLEMRRAMNEGNGEFQALARVGEPAPTKWEYTVRPTEIELIGAAPLRISDDSYMRAMDMCRDRIEKVIAE